jgi:hypothetical protein
MYMPLRPVACKKILDTPFFTLECSAFGLASPEKLFELLKNFWKNS